MLGGFQLLKFNFPQYFDKVAFVDPEVFTFLFQHESDEDMLKKCEESLKMQGKEAETILVPIWDQGPPFHWTILTGKKKDGAWSFVYRDTLQSPVVGNLKKAMQAVHLFQPDHPVDLVPENYFLQEGSTCGYWSLFYMLAEVSAPFEGPASRPPEVKSFKAKFQAFWQTLLKEYEKCDSERDEKELRAFQLKEQQQAAKLKAEETLSKVKNHSSALAVKAQASLEKNSQYFRVEELSLEGKYAVEGTMSALGICSKCRFKSGCLRCDPVKSLRYHWLKEAQGKGKVPGPDLPDWKTLSGHGFQCVRVGWLAGWLAGWGAGCLLLSLFPFLF